jgi:Ni,Fe-hydrogenase I cytochrome b subunit
MDKFVCTHGAPMKKSPFLAHQPAGLRIWHWLDAIVVFGLLGTVLLRKTVLSWRTNSAFIEDRLRDAGTSIEPALAASVAKGLRDAMWEWHIVLGVALSALLLLRIGVALATRTFPIKVAIDAFRSASGASGSEKRELLHFAVVRAGYVAFYLLLLFMVISGLLLTYGESVFSIAGRTMGTIKEAHELAMWLVLAFAFAHIVGVVVGELSGKRGIISVMINGGDKEGR